MAIFNMVYKNRPPRGPWEDTYLYRPLVSNANDKSWLNNNGTINWTVTWNDWAVFDWSWQISSPITSFPSSNFTISCWVYKTQNSTSEQILFWRWANDNYLKVGMSYDWNWNLRAWRWYYPNLNWEWVWNYWYNSWHNIIYVKNSPSSITVYVDGVQKASYTSDWSDGSSYNLWIWWWTSSNRSFRWTIREFIFEIKWRSSTNVSQYYNLTKWMFS